VHIAGRAAVEPGVGHADELTLSLVRRGVHHHVGVEDAAGDVVEQLPLRGLFDLTHLVERGEGIQPSLLDGHPDLVLAGPQVGGVHLGGGRDLVADGGRVRVHVVVQHDLDLAATARRRLVQRAGQDRRGRVRRGRPQRRIDLEATQVRTGPGDERQRADRAQVGRRVPAQVGVVRDVLLDLHASLAQLGALRVGQRLRRLHQDVVRGGRVGSVEAGRRQRRGLGQWIERDPVDGDARHAVAPLGPRQMSQSV